MILLTAFEPFGKSDVNASQEVAERLERRMNGLIAKAILPVVRHEAVRVALACVNGLRERETPPRLFVALGEAGPEAVVRLEKVYLNWDDYRIPDNAGNQPRDSAIEVDGPTAYFATVPVSKIEAELHHKTPLPVRVSLSAGAFLCNHTAYAVSHALACENSAGRNVPWFLFVHVPAWRPGDGEETLSALVETAEAVLLACLSTAS